MDEFVAALCEAEDTIVAYQKYENALMLRCGKSLVVVHAFPHLHSNSAFCAMCIDIFPFVYMKQVPNFIKNNCSNIMK